MWKVDPSYLLVRDESEKNLPFGRILAWFLVSRLVVFGIAAVAVHFIPPGRFGAYEEPLNWLYHWDAGWYLHIARHGYGWDSRFQFFGAFFPLYPLCIRVLGLVLDPRLAGYLISNGFLFLSCLLLWKLAQRDYRGVADRAVLFLLFNPTTVFFSSIYTESLFLFLALATAWFTLDRNWTAAGACGALAALTRPVGFLLAILIAVELFQRLRKKDLPPGRVERFRADVGIALPPAGLILFCLFLFWKYDDPLAVFHAEAQMHREFIPPWDLIEATGYHSALTMAWFISALVLGIYFTISAYILRLRASYLALIIAFMAVYCCTNNLEAFPRLLSVVFPFYFVAAECARRWPHFEFLFLGLSGGLGAFGVVLFADGYWFR